MRVLRTLRWSLTFAILFLPLFGLLARTLGSLELRVKKFSIISVKGPVMAWEPWTSAWEPVEAGTELWEDTLIQIGHKASFTFEIDAKRGFRNLRADKVQVTLNRPMVIRLEEEVLRKVKLNSYFISTLPEASKKEGAPAGPAPMNISEAWDRFAAMLSKDFGKVAPMFTRPDAPDEDSKLATKAKKIHIFTPRTGATVLSDSMPTEVKVTWRKLPEDVQYEIRLWKADSAQGPPLDTTRDDSYTLKVPEEGEYYLQISAADDRYLSSVHQLTVVQPTRGKTTPFYGAKTSPDKKPALTLLLPPVNFNEVGGKVPQTLTFRWEKVSGSAREQMYFFQVVDTAGKQMTLVKTTGLEAQFVVPQPGEYRWSVGTVLAPTDPEGKPLKILSEVRVFRFVPSLASIPQSSRQTSSGGAVPSDPLEALFFARSDGTFYLENGL